MNAIQDAKARIQAAKDRFNEPKVRIEEKKNYLADISGDILFDETYKGFSGFHYNYQGEYLGKFGVVDNVFVTEKISINPNKTPKEEFINSIKLDIKHQDFTYCAGVLIHEGSSYDEYYFFAHVTNNYSKKRKKTLKEVLESNYSTVPSSKKGMLLDIPLQNANKEKSNNVRKAIINLLLGNSDPTNKSEFWDGEDFLVWGLNSAPKEQKWYGKYIPKGKKSGDWKVSHNKFLEYKSIEIEKDIYVKFLTNISENGNKRFVKYSKYTHPRNTLLETIHHWDIPDLVFLDPNNWTSGNFYYFTGNGNLNLKATYVKSKSIYWKTE